MSLSFKVDVVKPVPAFMDPGRITRIFFEEIRSHMRQGLRTSRDWANRNTPVAATGALKASIVTNFPGQTPPDYKGELVWGAGYAQTAIRGGAPRTVPLARLRPWSAAVLGDPEDAIFVQAAIAKRGTPAPGFRDMRAHNLDRRFIDFMDPELEKIFEVAATKIGSRLEGM